MQYLGGKFRIAKQLSIFIESKRHYGQIYVEPFVGGGSVIQNIRGVRKGFDINLDLILLYKELQCGWIPPDTVSESLYKELKNSTTHSALRGFAGICCSFAGKWFGGYARSGNRNYALNGKNSLLKSLPKIKDVDFNHSDYINLSFKDSLIYCDPPYQNTTNYSVLKNKFNYNEFWNWVRLQSKNNTVLVSEYNAPDDFEIVWKVETKTDMHSKFKTKLARVEKVFQLK